MSHKTFILFNIAICFVCLAFAFYLQFIGYEPCHLCWLERYVYMAIIIISLVVFRYHKIFPGIVILWLVMNMLSIYHVCVEQGLVSSSCSMSSLMDNYATKGAVPCDIVKFHFLGLSLATYNIILSAILLIWSSLQYQSRIKIRKD